MRRRAALGSGIIAGSALGAACLPGGTRTAVPETGPQRAARPAKLSWMASGGAARVDLHRKQITRFRELTGHDVELVVVTGNYEEKLFADLAAGSAGDVVRLEAAYIPGLATRGQIAPIDAQIKRDRLDLPDFYEKGLMMYQWQGKQYSLPWLAFRALFYNADLLQQQGVSRPPDDWKDKRWNWQAFQNALRRFVNPSAPPQPGGTWAFHSPIQYLDAWVWVLGAGGDLFSADEQQFTLDQPAALEGLQFYADLITKDRAHPTPTQVAQDEGQAAFLAGRVAFYYGAANTAGRLRQAPFRAYVAPVPWGKAATATTGGGHSWPMNAASKEQDAAWEFQKFLASKENDLMQVESGEAPPYRKSTAALNEWRERKPPENPDTMAEGATYLKPQPKVPTWADINRVLNEALRPVWEGQRSAREAVQAAKPPIDQLLAQGWQGVRRS